MPLGRHRLVVTVEQSRIRVGRDGLLDSVQFAGVPEIVGIQKSDVLPPALPDAPISGGRGAPIGLADVTDAIEIGSEDLFGVVGRSVIDHNRLKS